MNPIELFNQLLMMTTALNATVIVISKTCSFPMSAVNLYEVTETLDEKDKPTGEFVPQITLTSGKEIDLTPEQNDIFRPLWNKKVSIDDKLRACIDAMDAQLSTAIAQQPAQS